MRKETKYNKIVNVSEDGEIQVLDSVFEYSDGFKGAVGSSFYPVSKEEYKERTSLESIIEYLESAVSEDGIPSVCENSYRKWAESIIECDEQDEFMFDTSYSELWDYMRDELGLTEDDAYIFECTCGGRMFDKNFYGNHNPELSAIIREYES